MTLVNHDGKPVPISQIGHVEMRPEDPLLRRRDRLLTITVRGDIDESLQPPQVSVEIQKQLAPIFPVMIVIILQTRSFPTMAMVFLTGPLGLIGTVATLLLFRQPFGFNSILGLIGLAGILMRNTLILIEQIRNNVHDEKRDPYHAVVEATVQRARPVLLTAMAAVLAFIPLTTSVFWGPMAYTLIGGTAIGTVLTLFFCRPCTRSGSRSNRRPTVLPPVHSTR